MLSAIQTERSNDGESRSTCRLLVGALVGFHRRSVASLTRRHAVGGRIGCWALACVGCMVVAGGTARPATAELIVAYATVGTSGSVAASETDSRVTGLDLTRGSGLVPSSGSTFNSRAWDGATLAEAQAGNDYLEWGWESSEAWDLEWLTVLYDRSGTGPSELAILLSIDDGMQWNMIHEDPFVAADSTDLAAVSLTQYQGVDRARFRLYAWNAGSSSGTLDLENFSTAPPRAIELTGQTAAVPEPVTTSLVASLTTTGYWLWHRRRKRRAAEGSSA